LIKNTARTLDFPTPELLPFSDPIPPNAEYCYVAQLFKSSPNANAVMWWKDGAGKCHYRCVLTGAYYEQVPGREVANREINCSEFQDLLGKLISLGILDVPSQPTTLIISDAHRVVSIRLADGRSNTYAIRGGVPTDPRASAIGALIYEEAPDFFPYTRRK